MRDYKVTLAQLSLAIERGNANAGGSYLEQGDQQYLIRGIGLLHSPDDIGNIIVPWHRPLIERIYTYWDGYQHHAAATG